MQTVIEAVYQNGVLHPLSTPPLQENERYRLIVEQTEVQEAPLSTNIQSAPDRSREYAWIKQHGAEYPGEYVALDGEQLLAHGNDGAAVLAAARQAGVAVPFLVRLDSAQEEGSWGGWL
jgi:predicted DNA-binding antitoxin AbrB/MazE fold protein